MSENTDHLVREASYEAILKQCVIEAFIIKLRYLMTNLYLLVLT